MREDQDHRARSTPHVNVAQKRHKRDIGDDVLHRAVRRQRCRIVVLRQHDPGHRQESKGHEGQRTEHEVESVRSRRNVIVQAVKRKAFGDRSVARRPCCGWWRRHLLLVVAWAAKHFVIPKSSGMLMIIRCLWYVSEPHPKSSHGREIAHRLAAQTREVSRAGEPPQPADADVGSVLPPDLVA